MSVFIFSSGLSPGSREAKVQRVKVCLNCTEPSVTRSSCWSLPVGRYLSGTCCESSVMILARWSASNMAEKPQTSISHQVRETRTTSGASDFCICDTWRVYNILKILCTAHVSNASRWECRYIKTGTMYVWQRRILVSSLMLDFQILLSNIFM